MHPVIIILALLTQAVSQTEFQTTRKYGTAYSITPLQISQLVTCTEDSYILCFTIYYIIYNQLSHNSICRKCCMSHFIHSIHLPASVVFTSQHSPKKQMQVILQVHAVDITYLRV